MAAVSAATVMGTVPLAGIPIQAKTQKTEKAEKTMGRYLESDDLSSQYFYIDKDKNVRELDLSGVIGSDDVLWDSAFTGNNTLVLSITG